MISDTLYEAISEIRRYQREFPQSYDDLQPRLDAMLVEMDSIRQLLDVSPGSTRPAPIPTPRFHFTDRQPFTVVTEEGTAILGDGWLAITEREYHLIRSTCPYDDQFAVREYAELKDGEAVITRLSISAMPEWAQRLYNGEPPISPAYFSGAPA